MSLIERSFREKIIIVGVQFREMTAEDVEASLDELALLVDTAGADVVGRVVQRRDSPDPATYLGAGKIEELHELALVVDADTVVFDDELSPAQHRNLERLLGRTAIDRTAVILDIFAQNARTQDGKAQVELALLRYRLPRLRGRGLSLSQQAGRIGTRGPGETQLETDRRRLQRRMNTLEKELIQVRKTRRTARKSRSRSGIATVSLVGYTNAGKSSMLNALAGSDVHVENRLFATLDPRTRRASLVPGEEVLLSDTVGFVKKLPHQLVEAFLSTLETVGESDLLLHVVDSSTYDPIAQIAAVEEVLDEIGASDIPTVYVLNKSDVEGSTADGLEKSLPNAVAVSALTGAGIEKLLQAISDSLHRNDRVVHFEVPYFRGDVLASIYRQAEVRNVIEDEESWHVVAKIGVENAAKLAEFEAIS